MNFLIFSVFRESIKLKCSIKSIKCQKYKVFNKELKHMDKNIIHFNDYSERRKIFKNYIFSINRKHYFQKKKFMLYILLFQVYKKLPIQICVSFESSPARQTSPYFQIEIWEIENDGLFFIFRCRWRGSQRVLL